MRADWRRTFLVVLVASFACTHGREDVGGTYVVDGDLTITTRDGTSSHTTIAKETITVKLNARHYQYGSYEMSVRGCKMTGDGPLSPAVVSTPRCTLDAPGGAVVVQAWGDVTQASGGDVDIHARGPALDDDGGLAGSFDYKVHGVSLAP